MPVERSPTKSQSPSTEEKYYYRYNSVVRDRVQQRLASSGIYIDADREFRAAK